MTLMNMLLHLTDSIRELAVAAESHGTIKTFLHCFIPPLQEKMCDLKYNMETAFYPYCLDLIYSWNENSM